MKVLDPMDQVVEFEIWNPRWHKERGKSHVFLAKDKVDRARTEHLKIVFTKSKAMEGDWYVSRTVARRHKVESNGVIPCYAVQLDKLVPLKIRERTIHVW
jgi:hypothetical protein